MNSNGDFLVIVKTGFNKYELTHRRADMPERNLVLHDLSWAEALGQVAVLMIGSPIHGFPMREVSVEQPAPQAQEKVGE